MPSKPRVACPIPGCPRLTPGGRCAAHASADSARRRASTGGAAYGQSAWQRRRKAYLYENPWCLLCAKQATVADHYPLSRRELIAQGADDPDAKQHLRPLCVSCHNTETAKHQPGGWAAEYAAMPVRGVLAFSRFNR